MGAVCFARVQVVLADVNGLAAVGAGHLIERLTGDIIVIVVLFGILFLFFGLLVILIVLIEVGFQILQLLAQVVDLVVGAGHIFIDAVHSLCQFAQQFAHGLDDLALFGGLVDAQALDQAPQVCSLFLHKNDLLSSSKNRAHGCPLPGLSVN